MDTLVEEVINAIKYLSGVALGQIAYARVVNLDGMTIVGMAVWMEAFDPLRLRLELVIVVDRK